MQIRWVIVIGFLCSLQSFAVEKIVKTYDGHRIICKTDAHVKEFLNQKAVQVLVAQDRQVLVQLVKCSHDGWVQDSNPTIERVDEAAIVHYPIYQNFHQYFLYVMKEGKLIQKAELKNVLSFGEEKLKLLEWEPKSEIFISTMTSITDVNGKLIDEKHEESFGSFNISKQ